MQRKPTQGRKSAVGYFHIMGATAPPNPRVWLSTSYAKHRPAFATSRRHSCSDDETVRTRLRSSRYGRATFMANKGVSLLASTSNSPPSRPIMFDFPVMPCSLVALSNPNYYNRTSLRSRLPAWVKKTQVRIPRRTEGDGKA